MGIDVETLALARKYADKVASGGTAPSNTYTKEELDKKFDEVKSSNIDINQLVQSSDEEFILFGGDSSV